LAGSDQIGYESRPSNQVYVETTSIKKVGKQMDGIELRDWFAGMAMQALINTASDRESSCGVTDAQESIVEAARATGWDTDSNLFKDGTNRYTLAEFISIEAYEIADAMMEVRKPVSNDPFQD